MRDEIVTLNDYIRSHGLKRTEQRIMILKEFLRIEYHLTAEELWRIVRRKNPAVGYATIYRVLKLFTDSGICRELKFGENVTRYEHLYGHAHHDHLICTECGRFEEIMDPGVEKLQKAIAKKKGYILTGHQLHLYGICRKCRKKE